MSWVFTAKYDGQCQACWEPWRKGDPITISEARRIAKRGKRSVWVHEKCRDQPVTVRYVEPTKNVL